MLILPSINAFGNVDLQNPPYGYLWDYPFNDRVLGQSFVPHHNNINGVDLYVRSTWFRDLPITVQLTGPGVNKYASAIVHVDNKDQWIHIDFDEPVPLTPGVYYKISPKTSWPLLSWVCIRDDYPYFDGSAYNGGSTISGYDFCFKTYYDPDYILPETDTTPPTINLGTASPNILWPPNHKLVDVTVTASWSDDKDPNPSVSVSVRCNEGQDGIGDGSTSPDWVKISNTHFQLRAERSGTGVDRVYTIMYTVRDSSGNRATASTTVIVPHDNIE